MSQDGPEGKGGKARHGALKADSLSASSERSGFVASFENTVLIRRPIEDVFALLSDFENVPKWNSAIVDTRKLSDGPVGVGTVYQQVRSGSESERRALRGHRLQPSPPPGDTRPAWAVPGRRLLR
jgi:Polyketide cyclase / dehydrase and lipid transport